MFSIKISIATIFILASTGSLFAVDLKTVTGVETVSTQIAACTVTIPKAMAVETAALPELPAPEWQSLFAEDHGAPIGLAALQHLTISARP